MSKNDRGDLTVEIIEEVKEKILLWKLCWIVCVWNIGKRKIRERGKGINKKMCDRQICGLQISGQPDLSCQHQRFQERLILLWYLGYHDLSKCQPGHLSVQTNPPVVVGVLMAKIENNNGISRRMRNLPLLFLHPSPPGTACSWRMWQGVSPNKVPAKIERDGASPKVGRRDWVFADGKRRK